MATAAVAYYRVSRHDTPNELLERVANFVRDCGWVLLEPFVESDAARSRPELDRALARCSESGALLVVPELASAARDPAFLAAVLQARVPLAAPDRSRVGRRTLELLLAVAERQRATRAARSREALSRARRRGVRLGSPKPELGAQRAAQVLHDRADARARALAPALAEARLSNPEASLREIGCVLDAMAAPAPRGGRWGPSAVRNLLRRLELDPDR